MPTMNSTDFDVQSWDATREHCEKFLRKDARTYEMPGVPSLDFEALCQEARMRIWIVWSDHHDTMSADRLVKHWRTCSQNAMRDLRRAATTRSRDPRRERRLSPAPEQTGSEGDKMTWQSVADTRAEGIVDMVMIREIVDTIHCALPPLGRRVLKLLLDPPACADAGFRSHRSPTTSAEEVAHSLSVSVAQARPALRAVRAQLYEALRLNGDVP